MDTFDAIETRRSVKKFDPDHEMSDAERDRLLSLTLLSPTSFNIQNWRFLDIRDRGLRQQFREIAWNQAQVTDASMLLLLAADLKSFEKEPERYWKNAPDVAGFLVPMIVKCYDGQDQLQRDEAMRSTGIASQTIMLAARAMGYDSCPMVGFDFDAAAKLVGLPDDHVISMLIAIGKPLEPARGRGGQLPLDEVVFTDRFPAGEGG